MNIQKIISNFKKKPYLVISEDELKVLLSLSEIIIEKDTLISDKIRLLKINNELIIQEKSNKEEIIIRLMNTINDAEKLIAERMETYDKMWDGCGCKVEYYT